MLNALSCYILLSYLLASVFLASASPLSTLPRSDGPIKIPLIKRAPWNTPRSLVSLKAEVAHALDKYDRGFTAFNANTGRVHPLTSSFYGVYPDLAHTTKRAAGGDTITPAQGATMWSGNISVGSPPRPFSVDFDTGSADLFLPGMGCSTCAGHSLYDPSQSQTSQDISANFTLEYGDGSAVIGRQFRDTVVFAGLTAKGQTLGSASKFSTQLAASVFQADGILGMGFRDLAALNGAPVFETMINQGQPDSGVFAIRLAAPDEGSSELYLGGVDPQYYEGDFTYTNVTEPAYWQVTLSAIQIGLDGRSVEVEIPAIVDTGTTLIIGDQERVHSFYEHVLGAREIPDGSGFWEVPCITPTVSLVFGGKAFPLLPQAFVIPAADTDEPGFCVGSVVSFGESPSGGQSDPGFWVVGDAFLRGVYTVFDVDNKRVGFADLRINN